MIISIFTLALMAEGFMANPTPQADDNSTYYMLHGKKYSIHFTEADEEMAANFDVAKAVKNNANPLGGGPASPNYVWDPEVLPDFDLKIAHFTVNAMWSGEIPYVINGFGDQDRGAILNAINHIQSHCKLRFVGGNNGNPKLLTFTASSNGDGVCRTTFNFPGHDKVTAEVKLPPSTQCTVPRTIIHEIFHALGHFHTHQRTDRDSHVTINSGNYNSWMNSEFERCEVPSGQPDQYYCNVFGQPYECDSIMHYASDQFTTNGQDTIVAKNPGSCQLKKFGDWNQHQPYLSRGDIKRLQDQYGA